MRNRLLTFLFFAACVVNAQVFIEKRTCGTEVPGETWDQWFNTKVEEFKRNNPAAKGQSAGYTIPVIIHLIHGGEQIGTYPNLSRSQIYSQLNVLNADFAGTGYNVQKFATTSFQPSLLANSGITFCPAQKDPSGNDLSEAGIERINYTSKSWAGPSSFGTLLNFKNYMEGTVKPNTIWDPTRYLNIWVSDKGGSVNLLGYATFPPGAGLVGPQPAPIGSATNDGVWCYAKTFGDEGFLAPNYDKGRTATHEIGHYLGLRHIWGDAVCGDDYCSDTPPQQQQNENCPSFPHITCSPGPNGDLFMNFMDYCPDYCMYMFTEDQCTRMQTSLANSPLRMQLTASAATLCTMGPVGISNKHITEESFNLAPNPSKGNPVVLTSIALSQETQVTVYTILGEIIFRDIITPVKQNRIEINIQDQPAGIYSVEVNTGQIKLVKRLVLEK